MIRKFKVWRQERRIPTVQFGETVRVMVHGQPYYMRLSDFTIDRHGHTAVLHDLARWIEGD